MTLLNEFLKSIYLYLFCILVIVTYTGMIYIIGHSFMPEKARGSLIIDESGELRGSNLLIQSFTEDSYFHGRLNARFDSKCDVALYNEIFKDSINSRYKIAENKDDISMITPSSSLLDPYITRKEALRQAPRVANARGRDVDEIISLVDKHTLASVLPFFELDIVNVTVLNSLLVEVNPL